MTARELLDAYAREVRPILLIKGDALEKGQAAPKAFTALRKVLERHRDYGDGSCAECAEMFSLSAERPGNPLPFPCPTVQDITETLEETA